METRTKIKVTGKGFYGEIAKGKITAINPLENGGLEFCGFYYRTVETKDKEDETILVEEVIKTFENTFSSEKVETLFKNVKGSLTSGLNGVKSLWEQAYLAFAIIKAEEFGISLEDIEII